MNLITKENAARNIYEDGFVIVIETAIAKGSDEKIKIGFDLSQCDVMQTTYPACKDKLSDVRNTANADIKRAAEKGETLTFTEAVASRLVLDEGTGVYMLRVKDSFNRTRSAPQAKSITAQAAAMTPEKIAETIVALQKMLEAKQS